MKKSSGIEEGSAINLRPWIMESGFMDSGRGSWIQDSWIQAVDHGFRHSRSVCVRASMWAGFKAIHIIPQRDLAQLNAQFDE